MADNIQKPEVINVIFNGLSTFPNQFSQVPQAPRIGLVQADEMVVDKDGILSTRRGVEEYDQMTNVQGTYAKSWIEFGPENNLIKHTDTNKLVYTNSSIATETTISGTYYVPVPSDTSSRVRFAQENNNLYFTTSNGIYKIDSIDNTPILAGAPAGLDGIAVTTGSPGFLQTNSNVAYRVEWQYYDANNNLVNGAPSDRIIVGNLQAGYQDIVLNTTVTGASSTGLSGATIYHCSIQLDGAATTNIAITGSTATTYTTLINQLQTALSGITVSIVNVSGVSHLRIQSSDTNLGSAILVVDGPATNLFSSLTQYASIATPYSATTNVQLTIQVPRGVDTTWTYVVYRGNQSASITTSPDDECQQVYQGSPTSTQITNRLITFTDNLPDDLRGTTIDTAPSQQGIQNANYQPPLAKDMAVFRNYTFYANTISLYELNLTLVNVGSPTGLQVGDTISFYDINNTLLFTLTGDTTETTSTGHFQVYTASDPATNIQYTSQSLVRVANLYAANTTLNAYYTSDFNELPGQLNFSNANLTTDQFYVVCSRTGNVFNPNIPASGATQSNTAQNDVKTNRIYYSKYLQPEAVPLGNYIDVGTSENVIVRIQALKESLLVFKGGLEGIFLISGTDPSTFQVVPFDRTTHITAPNSCALINNSVYMFSDQGVVSVSDTGGVQILSRPIERDLLTLASSNFPNFAQVCYGADYQSDRKYILGLPTTSSDTTATQIYVYNYITSAWTRWTRPFNSFYNRPSDDKLYFSERNSTGCYIDVERKTYTDADYVDETYTLSITSANGYVIKLNSSVNAQVGMWIQQGNTGGFINSIDTQNNITMSVNGWTTGSCVLQTPITETFITLPIHGNQPDIMKQWTEWSLLFGPTAFASSTAGFITDLTQTVPSALTILPNINVPNPSTTATNFGQAYFGNEIFGGSTTMLNKRFRSLIPKQYQRANWIQFTWTATHIYGATILQGLGLTYRLTSSKIR